MWGLAWLRIMPRIARALGPPHYIETDSRCTCGGEQDVWAFGLSSGQCLMIVHEANAAEFYGNPPEVEPILLARDRTWTIRGLVCIRNLACCSQTPVWERTPRNSRFAHLSHAWLRPGEQLASVRRARETGVSRSAFPNRSLGTRADLFPNALDDFLFAIATRHRSLRASMSNNLAWLKSGMVGRREGSVKQLIDG